MNATASKWTRLVTGAIKFLPEAQWVGIVVELLSQLASSMGATSGDSRQALAQVETLRADLNHITAANITAANAGLSQQLEEQAKTLALQSRQLDALDAELRLTTLAATAFEVRLAVVEARITRILNFVVALGIASLISILLLVIMLVKLRAAH